MRSRACLGLVVVALTVFGCDDAQYAGPIRYRDHERMALELAEKPKLQATIRKALTDLFGEDLRHIKVPEESGLREDGKYLGNFLRVGEKREPVLERDPVSGQSTPITGGYALYRKHCLHCHGVSGAGDGPTAEYLYPRPRDYRPGIFKFTSTNPVNAKPTRDDLRRTLLYGLNGTSMPGFEVTMSASEIEQVIDYLMFLSIRGETERYLIDEAILADDADAESALEPDLIAEIVSKVTTSWTDAETQVVNPSTRRGVSSKESVARGRDYFLGTNSTGPKLECVTCHGASGKGNGPAFVEPEIFNDVVFRQWPLDQAIERRYEADLAKTQTGSHGTGDETHKPDVGGVATFLAENPDFMTHLRKKRGLLAELDDSQFAKLLEADPTKIAAEARKLLPSLDDPEFRTYLLSKIDLWGKSLDFWQNPLRPANLLEGTYKGGQRPLDLYWRLAKGINGAKMPAHAGLLNDDQIWDVVNFVLAVRDDPGLLPDSAPKPTRTTSVAASDVSTARRPEQSRE
ncbi:c-type cytochrome [Tundrisphaera lichenicola]|uniref:c-type cytochrome n=1 Tax=Tundrisphaera lichenicola TaxID=2029860 RepID=UPI003EBB7C4D